MRYEMCDWNITGRIILNSKFSNPILIVSVVNSPFSYVLS